MHFENVQLPSTVIADLYRHSLVVLEDVQPENKISKVEEAGVMIAAATPKAATPNIPAIAAVTADAVPAGVKSQSTAQGLKYLGGFQKQIAIVLTEHFHPHIAEEDLDFLSKLLTACKLSMNDVAIINVVNNSVAPETWQALPVKVMLMFDVDPAAIGLPFVRPNFEIQEWAGAAYMSGPELNQFRNGNEQEIKLLKSKLWVSLQKIFLGK